MKRNTVAVVLIFLSILATAQIKPVITVLDFKTSGVSEREMKSIISLISNTLFKTGKYTVIDVEQRERLFKEIEFSMSDCVDEKCQIEAGKQLSAELIVVGSIDKIGSSLVLASKVLETQSGRTLSVADGIYRDLDELVKNIGKVGSELAGAPLATDEPKKRSIASSTSAASTIRPAPPGFVLVEAGSFRMGSTSGEEDQQPVHSVTISRSFYISKSETTQKQWREVMSTNPPAFRGDTMPVELVSWYEAVEYCNRLSQRDGLAPCYSGSDYSITCDFSANGYRLPTEAEWEYAARGGKQSKSTTYAGSNSASVAGWYSDNSNATTHPVGQKRRNELGLYDMSGNVWEWCWDWYGPYVSIQETDPQGAQPGSERVIRGGCWNSSAASFLRPTYRNVRSPVRTDIAVGFRPVRTAEQHP
jgi:sulfatase modifying factor 1